MATLNIRLASIEDTDRLAAVYRNAYQENLQFGFPAKAESVTADKVSEWIQAAHVFVGTVHVEIVGGVRLKATEADKVKLSRLDVHSEWKGKALGASWWSFHRSGHGTPRPRSSG